MKTPNFLRRTGTVLLAASIVAAAALQAGDRTLGSSDNPGILKTKVKPDDTGVYVDGEYAGHADRFSGPGENLFLPPGRHEIRFSIAFYKDYTTTVDIKPGEKTVIRHQMEPTGEKPPNGPYGRIKIQPPKSELNAAVLVNGVHIGYADQVNKIAQTLLLTPGKHDIELRYAGYQPYKTTLEVEANKKYVLTPTLQAK